MAVLRKFILIGVPLIVVSLLGWLFVSQTEATSMASERGLNPNVSSEVDASGGGSPEKSVPLQNSLQKGGLVGGSNLVSAVESPRQRVVQASYPSTSAQKYRRQTARELKQASRAELDPYSRIVAASKQVDSPRPSQIELPEFADAAFGPSSQNVANHSASSLPNQRYQLDQPTAFGVATTPKNLDSLQQRFPVQEDDQSFRPPARSSQQTVSRSANPVARSTQPARSLSRDSHGEESSFSNQRLPLSNTANRPATNSNPVPQSNTSPQRQPETPFKFAGFGRGSTTTGPIPTPSRTPEPKTTTAPRQPAGPKKEPAKKGPPKKAQNTISSTVFNLAGQPRFGAHYKDDTPTIDNRAFDTSPSTFDFGPDPNYDYTPYDPGAQMNVYGGKTLNANQRPLVEIGRPWYHLGQLPENKFWLGYHNPVSPQFIIFGDSRWAFASNRVNGDTVTQVAAELNMFFNLQLTGTERFHMFVAPLDNGVKNHRYLLDDDRLDEELDFDVDFGYFEGDLGAIVGGMVGQTLPFDLPFAIGVMPLLVQNGVWMEDAFLGVAATIPARNSPRFDISNMDITFFAGFDEIISPAFEFEDDAAKMVGMMAFIEANNGYWEIDYAFLEDRTARDRSYHNIGLAFTRRFGRFLSNSTRVIINAGQSTEGGDNTADGVLLLSENSLITAAPSTVIPYFNLFAGFDSPQSAVRAGAAGGILRNTGILFESDGMTGYPTLDATAQNTYGLAAGINLMPNDFSQQLVLEVAMLGVMGDQAYRNARGDQYGIGARYQLPLNNSMILRVDGMVGFLRNDEDVNGVRVELRHKF